MKKPTLSLCLIVKASDDEAELLNRLLSKTPPVFDEICITITGKNKKVEEVAKQYNAKISYFDWINDFSAARNFNFSQATSDYIMWVDSDDLIKGAENIPNLMEKIGKDGNVIDAIVMDYLYDFDEYGVCIVKHLKTRIVKNDGCVKWVGALHEDFSPTRELLAEKCPDIQIVHLTNDKRVKDNFARNTTIAKSVLEKNPDDPRSYWLVANALLSEGKDKESLDYYYQFIEKSNSEEEIFLAWHRIADVFMRLGEFDKAFMAELQALRLRPYYPDAYFGLGKLYFEQHKYREAESVILDGLKKEIPSDEIIVYNPRDYDVNPLNLLARVYFAMDKPRESKMCLEKILKIYPHREDIKKVIEVLDESIKKIEEVEAISKKVLKAKNKKEIKKILDSVPDEMKSHPAICAIRNTHFVKEKSSGKDIAFYCGYTGEVWTPESVKTGIGGSEEAVINLSRELAKLGWNVEVYNNCGYKEQVFDGVKYKPFWMFNTKDKQDIIIAWRYPKLLDFELNAKKIFLDLHDVINIGELTSPRVNKLTKIFVKSKAQRDLYPHIPDNKFAIIPNGVDISLFEKFEKEEIRNPYYLVNFSSPNRSLETLLEMIEEIIKRLPKEIADKVKFAWYYGWNVFDVAYENNPEAKEWKEKVMNKFNYLKEKGIIEGGERIGHEEVAKKYLQAGALVYPTEFFEIDYIGGSKAQIAGCVPITTDFAALNEKIQFGVKIHSNKTKDNWTDGIKFNCGIKDPEIKEQFIEAVVNYLNNPDKWEEERKKMSEWAKKEFNWQRIAELWNKELI